MDKFTLKEMRMSAVRTLLNSIPGENPMREGLKGTPERVARMYDEIFGGYELDPAAILNKTFAVSDSLEVEDLEDAYSRGIVIVKDIPFYSHCEHHMVPFFGHAWVAYVPGDRVVGLSKICRVVDAYARRLQIQERLTNQIAECIDEVLHPQGVMVVVKAEHLCMSMRGVKKPGSNTVTSCVRGVFVSNNEAREEALKLFNM